MISNRLKNNDQIKAIYQSLKSFAEWLADNRLFFLASKMEYMLSNLSRDPRHISRRNTYQRLGEINKRFEHTKKFGNQGYPIYFINLDRDTGRLQRFDRRAKKLNIHYTRVSAYDALSPSFDFKAYSHLIANTFWGGGTSLKRGSIGCYLSHAEVWERICNEQIDNAIILEDDAYPLCSFPQKIDYFNLPADYDIIRINTRTGNWLELEMAQLPSKSGLFIVRPYHHLLQQMFAQCGTIMATGTDGYILSRKGAEKLRKILQLSKICSGVDWMVTLHSMTPLFRERMLKKIPEMERKGIEGLTTSNLFLESYVLMPSLVDHRDFNLSHIDHGNISKRIDRSEMMIDR